MRLHMQPVCNQRAANRPAVLRVTVSICLSPAGTDMRYMHIHTHTRVQVYIPYTCKTHGSAQSLDEKQRLKLCFPKFGLWIWKHNSNCQATRGNKKWTGILVAANSRSHWRSPVSMPWLTSAKSRPAKAR